MKIDYYKILRFNLINTLKDILKIIKHDGLGYDNHLYITFDTNNNKVISPKWIKEKYPEQMTIIIQYEFWDLIIKDEFFKIALSFNDIKVNLNIPYDSIISFADPKSNFGLNLIQNKKIDPPKTKDKKNKKISETNVIEFKSFKKTRKDN